MPNNCRLESFDQDSPGPRLLRKVHRVSFHLKEHAALSHTPTSLRVLYIIVKMSEPTAPANHGNGEAQHLEGQLPDAPMPQEAPATNGTADSMDVEMKEEPVEVGTGHHSIPNWTTNQFTHSQTSLQQMYRRRKTQLRLQPQSTLQPTPPRPLPPRLLPSFRRNRRHRKQLYPLPPRPQPHHHPRSPLPRLFHSPLLQPPPRRLHQQRPQCRLAIIALIARRAPARHVRDNRRNSSSSRAKRCRMALPHACT